MGILAPREGIFSVRELRNVANDRVPNEMEINAILKETFSRSVNFYLFVVSWIILWKMI